MRQALCAAGNAWRPRVRLAALAAFACVPSCAMPPLSPDAPRAVDRLAIAPYAAHEQCADLAAGERLDYRYRSSAPLDFEIRYREDNVLVSPIVRQQSTTGSGIFDVRAAARYCLNWQAGAAGAIIGYRVLVRRDRE